MSLIVVYL